MTIFDYLTHRKQFGNSIPRSKFKQQVPEKNKFPKKHVPEKIGLSLQLEKTSARKKQGPEKKKQFPEKTSPRKKQVPEKISPRKKNKSPKKSEQYIIFYITILYIIFSILLTCYCHSSSLDSNHYRIRKIGFQLKYM